MKIEYDPVHDLLNLAFLAGVEIEESLEVDGIILDYAQDRRILAIEVLDAGKRTTQDPLHLIKVAVVRQPASGISAKRLHAFGRFILQISTSCRTLSTRRPLEGSPSVVPRSRPSPKHAW